MTDAQAYKLVGAIRAAIDNALDDGVSLDEIKEEIEYQVDTYDWEDV